MKEESNLNIVEQLYQSLIQFSPLRSIPPSYLSTILPFAIDKKNHGKYSSGYHLQTRNEELLSFLGNVKVKNGKLEISKEYENELLEKIGEDYRERIIEIFKKLRGSGIHCIQRIEDRSKENHNRIIIRTNEACECKRCLYWNLKFDVLLDKIEKEEIEKYNAHDINDSLIDAFAHFKINNYLKSYHIISKLVEEALEEKNYKAFFLYQFNRKKYRGYINNLFVPEEISLEEKDRIIDEID